MLVGIHLPNDGEIREHRWKQIAPFDLFLALVRLDDSTEEVDFAELRERTRSDAQYILRLYWPGYMEADEVVRRADERLPAILSQLGGVKRCRIALGNEPNHIDGHEGFGPTLAHARDFGLWYDELLSKMREREYKRLGFPGLALGDAHGEHAWRSSLLDLIERSNWVGVHAYWQIIDHILNPAFGRNWQWYERHVNRPVIVTEYACSACHSDTIPNPSDVSQAQQYARWCNDAARGGVEGSVAFMLDGSAHWSGFRLSDYTLSTLAGLNLRHV